MTRCESYPPCFGTIYFPTAPLSLVFYDVTGLLHCYAIPAILEHLILP